ncbi:MAG TPA: sirohydrochlorin chelatase [Pseudonocardiaceae bacterium]|jgi:sirohydrochlorin ferrochelatase|nr:sirohydrochlorin chelatase [Pseudonocardiaceae bacterium]
MADMYGESAPVPSVRLTPTLVAVAHGSREPRSAGTVSALIDRVRLLRPDLDVRLAFLDLCAPRLDAVLATVPRAVVVPLLLGDAYHAKVDVPGEVARATAARPGLDVVIADVLGPDPRLEDAALGRLAEAGVSPEDPDVGVVLAAAGSSHPPANATLAAVAARWTRRSRWQVVPAFACAARPTVPDAIITLRIAGARRIAVACWFLAPGLLPGKITRLALSASPQARLAAPLGAHDAVAALIADRYDLALQAPMAHPA